MADVAVRRYARALFMLAEERGLLSEYGDAARLLLDVFAADESFGIVFRHAQITGAEKMALVEKALKGAVPDDFLGLIEVVIRKNREKEMEKILECFITLVREALCVTEAAVETASPLTDAQSEALTARLGKLTGKTVTLSVTVKPELIAGFRVVVGGHVLDGTIRQKLDSFKKHLMNLQLTKSEAAAE